MRRNSESSVTSRHSRLIESEDEKKRQERRRRERRHRDRREKKPNGKLDIIDKLDVSSIYGSGCEYLRMISRATADRGQYFIMTGPSMLATHTGTVKEADVHLCMLLPKTRSIMLLVAGVL